MGTRPFSGLPSSLLSQGGLDAGYGCLDRDRARQGVGTKLWGFPSTASLLFMTTEYRMISPPSMAYAKTYVEAMGPVRVEERCGAKSKRGPPTGHYAAAI